MATKPYFHIIRYKHCIEIPKQSCMHAKFPEVAPLSSRISSVYPIVLLKHDDVIKWKHFPRYWPFVRGIHRWPVNSPHKGQWRGALMFSFICVWINSWINNCEASDLRRYCAHYDVIVMAFSPPWCSVTVKHAYTVYLIKYTHGFVVIVYYEFLFILKVIQMIY